MTNNYLRSLVLVPVNSEVCLLLYMDAGVRRPGGLQPYRMSDGLQSPALPT